MKLTWNDLGPLTRTGDGVDERITRPLGPVTLLVKGSWGVMQEDQLVVVGKGDGPRIGRSSDLARLAIGFKRFSAELWDERTLRWTKRRAFELTRLVGLVAVDDPGLRVLGVPVAEPSPLIVVGAM